MQVFGFCSSSARLCCPEKMYRSWVSALYLEPYVPYARQCDRQTSPSPRAKKRCLIYSLPYRNKDDNADLYILDMKISWFFLMLR